jgi:hypothetical protein
MIRSKKNPTAKGLRPQEEVVKVYKKTQILNGIGLYSY